MCSSLHCACVITTCDWRSVFASAAAARTNPFDLTLWEPPSGFLFRISALVCSVTANVSIFVQNCVAFPSPRNNLQPYECFEKKFCRRRHRVGGLAVRNGEQLAWEWLVYTSVSIIIVSSSRAPPAVLVTWSMLITPSAGVITVSPEHTYDCVLGIVLTGAV